MICLRCIHELPHTKFQLQSENPVEHIFRGRFTLRAAHSEFYFSKGKIIQTLVHQLKYKGNRDIGLWLGKMMGISMSRSGRFSGVDYLIPVPLNIKREHKRGYNQAYIICKGISELMNIPVMAGQLLRSKETSTQTKKHRTERWENVSGGFELNDRSVLNGKHLLLVDDVLTTGATIEACAQVLLSVPKVDLSIATLAIANK